MLIELTDTDSASIESSIRRARRHLGVATGQVFTLIVVCSEEHYEASVEAARDAGRAHPSRVLIVVPGGASDTRLDATIETGETVPGDVISLRVYGDLVEHSDSVLLPLLLPDSPVVVWWPFDAPVDPGSDRLGRLGSRRVTDAAGSPDPIAALEQRAAHLTPGDTDLTWTRLTKWRALIAAALDQYPTQVTAATVTAAQGNAPAQLMAAWLRSRLDVPVSVTTSEGPGVTAVRLQTPGGEIAVVRTDKMMASYEVPGEPRRQVALRRRTLTQLLTEELGRLDDDQVFDATLAELGQRGTIPATASTAAGES